MIPGAAERRRVFAEVAAATEARGEARGTAKTLLWILAQRGLPWSEGQQRRIVECTDLPTLDGWLDRALLAASVDELVGPVENALTVEVRSNLNRMTAAPAYFSEMFFRAWWKGVPKGEAKALLRIVAQRGLPVSEDQHQRIVECTNTDMLDTWLDRALRVASVDELLG